MPPRKSKRSAAAAAAAKMKEAVDSEAGDAAVSEPGPSAPKREKKEQKTKSSAAPEKNVKEKKMKSVVVKGRAPVDVKCPNAGSCHVYFDDDEGGVWDCMLNQTNIQNNNNKYYLIQLLKSDAGSSYFVWMRWGRVGYDGQNSLTPCGSNLEMAKDAFRKKFLQKTSNAWEERADFEKYPNKYDLVCMDYSADETDASSAEKENRASSEAQPPAKKVPASALAKSVQDLVELICDVKAMEQAVIEMEYDTKRAPLGKITDEQIKAGYTALNEISDLIAAKKTSGPAILHACNDFYTRIPHEFGFRVPPVIRTMAEVKRKIELLEALGDIEVAMKIISATADADTNPVDFHYGQLECKLECLERTDGDFRLVEEYIRTTHAKTHSMYTMEVLEIFACSKEEEERRFMDCGGRKLLFHGSRLSNYAGILSQGLRIAPPEAPPTGYMFGKGIYFADMSSKSANYCWPSHTNDVGLLLLCEVSLGNPHEIIDADYCAGENLPADAHSVMGLGKVVPSKQSALSDGTVVPLGPTVNTGVSNPAGYTLNYNEYIVYDPAQVKMRYLAKIKFDFKKLR